MGVFTAPFTYGVEPSPLVDSVYVQQENEGKSYPPSGSKELLTEGGTFILTEGLKFLSTE